MVGRYIVRERDDGFRMRHSPEWIGWDVIDARTGKVVPGHENYDYRDEAQSAADRLEEKV